MSDTPLTDAIVNLNRFQESLLTDLARELAKPVGEQKAVGARMARQLRAGMRTALLDPAGSMRIVNEYAEQDGYPVIRVTGRAAA